MLKSEDILQCVDGYILVVNQKNDEIVFSNYKTAEELYRKFGAQVKNNIISFNNRNYYIDTKNIVKENEKYLYIHYYDITLFLKYEQQLIKKAMTDSLTSVYNRHGIEKAIEENYRTALTSSCVVYADIDHFKMVNDTYSHEAGDLVLSEVAKIISDNIRKDDRVGRMGGEEFIIILNSTSIEKAKPKLDYIRKAIKQHNFSWNGNQIKVTVSFGVSEFEPKEGSDFNKTIAEADRALLQSKKNGRDQITYFNEMEPKIDDSFKTRRK